MKFKLFASLILIQFALASCSPKETKTIEEKPKTETVSQLEVYQKQLASNKEIVKTFVTAMQNSDTATLATMITDDFTWWIIGKPEYLATGGEHDRAYFLGFFKGAELFPEGMNFTVTSMVAEGNSVATEAEIKAKTAMGSFYENYYHFLFVIENGKIKRMKEYMDTYHAKTTFGL